MEKTTIFDIRADLKAKRDALSLAHEELKKNCDDWNKCVIVLSLFNGMIETIKIQLQLDSDGFRLLPIFISSIIAIISSLIKFRDFPAKMEVLIQSQSLLTTTLNKYRNNDEIDKELVYEYNSALEKLETSVYPDIRKKYLQQSHRNLLSIMKLEQKYFKNIELVNNGEKPEDDTLSSSSSEKSNPIRDDHRYDDPLATDL
tara:strand:- start:103 stop:705 length:603 start_codon:yes stop_codon:yes gene_type:complete